MNKLGDFYCPWKIKCVSSYDFDIDKLPLSSYPYMGGLKYVWPTSLEMYIPTVKIILKPDYNTRYTLYHIDEVPHFSIRFFVCPQAALNLSSQEIPTYSIQHQLCDIPNNYKNGLSYQNILENLLKENKRFIIPIITPDLLIQDKHSKEITKYKIEYLTHAWLSKRQKYLKLLHIHTHNTSIAVTNEGEIFTEVR
jgi:hypothetical protein